LLLAMGAAVVHALWNLAIAREQDTHAVTAVALVCGCLVLTPFAAATWRFEASAVPYAIASTSLELAYFAFLAAAYRRDGLSSVYPLARGVAPVLVLAISVSFLGASLSVMAAVGVLAIAAGVLAVRAARWRGPGAALAVGACIAGYTLVDKYGLEHASPLAYLLVVLAAPAAAYAIAMRRRLGAAFRSPAPLAGVGVVGAYGLTLAALALAPAAAVAAVRESSVVIGVCLAAAFLHERVTPWQVAGAVSVTVGVAAIAVGS